MNPINFKWCPQCGDHTVHSYEGTCNGCTARVGAHSERFQELQRSAGHAVHYHATNTAAGDIRDYSTLDDITPTEASEHVSYAARYVRADDIVGASDETRRAMAEAPEYWLAWYTFKSLALVAVAGIAAYQVGVARARAGMTK